MRRFIEFPIPDNLEYIPKLMAPFSLEMSVNMCTELSTRNAKSPLQTFLFGIVHQTVRNYSVAFYDRY